MTTTTTARPFKAVFATAFLCAGGSIVAALPAVADAFDAPQVTVKYEDLNVSSQQGAAALYSRIRNAAKSVCSQFDRSGIDGAIHRNACVDKAILGAVTKVNNAALYAVSGMKSEKEVQTHLASLSK